MSPSLLSGAILKESCAFSLKRDLTNGELEMIETFLTPWTIFHVSIISYIEKSPEVSKTRLSFKMAHWSAKGIIYRSFSCGLKKVFKLSQTPVSREGWYPTRVNKRTRLSFHIPFQCIFLLFISFSGIRWQTFRFIVKIVSCVLYVVRSVQDTDPDTAHW